MKYINHSTLVKLDRVLIAEHTNPAGNPKDVIGKITGRRMLCQLPAPKHPLATSVMLRSAPASLPCWDSRPMASIPPCRCKIMQCEAGGTVVSSCYCWVPAFDNRNSRRLCDLQLLALLALSDRLYHC